MWQVDLPRVPAARGRPATRGRLGLPRGRVEKPLACHTQICQRPATPKAIDLPHPNLRPATHKHHTPYLWIIKWKNVLTAQEKNLKKKHKVNYKL